MKNFKMLSKAEMRKIAGGNSDSFCATDCKCPPGYVIKQGGFTISIECNGNCLAVQHDSVTCGTTQKKCNDYDEVVKYCEKAPEN
jgi:hypothetical protein